jgi:hypothetical protein
MHGVLKVRRAYYYCHRCKQSFIPYDDALGLVDDISPGLMPLVCLAGTLLPFADAARDILKRYAGVRLSTSTVLRSTEAAGQRLRAQQKEGRMVQPLQTEPKWTATREAGQPAAYVGLDAFSVPMQGVQASKAEHRMLYTASKRPRAFSMSKGVKPCSRMSVPSHCRPARRRRFERNSAS